MQDLAELVEDTSIPLVKSDEGKLELYSDNYPFRLSLRITKFDDEASYKKFLTNCERLVRGSIEYKLWRNYITDVLNVTSCMVTKETMIDCTIEIHHHIPTLFQLVKAIVNKKMDENQEFSTFDICLETIEMHFMNKIGYLALISSMHEKLHNGHLEVPVSFMKGDYNYFMSNYARYLDDDDNDIIMRRLAVTTKNVSWDKETYPGFEGIVK